MYSDQNPPLYQTRHYIHDPQTNQRNNNNTNNYNNPSYDRSRQPAQPYPYYNNNQPPTTVTYINDRSNYGQQSPSYVPPNTNRYPPTNNHSRSSNHGPARGSGGIEKTNIMSNESPFYDPARPYEQYNTPRTVTSITSQAKPTGEFNKTLNLSDENPFHTVYGGYHYPSQIDPTKRITTQNTAVRSTDNKSLNLSDESPFFATYGGYHYPSQIDPAKRITTQNTVERSTDNKSLNLSDESPFFSTYGHYHYPSQIDPQKRITEMPKAAGQLMPTNEMSSENPFSNQPSSNRANNGSNYDWNRNNDPAPLSYRPIQVQKPQQSYQNQQPSSSFRPPSPPAAPPARIQPQKPNPSAPLDKTSLNMSPDNPFAQTYGQYVYPSPEEIKAQKRNNNRHSEQRQQQQQQPPINNNNNRSVQPSNQMTEYPESEKKEVIQGKGNTKFTRFDVNF